MKVRRFSDGLFRLGPIKVGADGLIGFIPGAGDVYAIGAGGYLLHLAWRAGAPRSVMAKMTAWLALDLATGVVPLAGDAVDFFYRGHAKAAQELERWLDVVHPEGRKPVEPRWRGWADVGIGLGSWIPAFAWGLIFANIVHGVDLDERGDMTSEVWDLLNPYGLLGGIATLGLFLLHGAIFVALKSDGDVRVDARRLAARMWLPVTAIGAVFAVWTQLEHGKPWTWAMVALAAGGLLAVGPLIRVGRELAAFFATSLTVIGVSVLLFGALLPNVLNATDPARSITIEAAASSHYTLVVMSWCLVVLLPLVMIYQAWTYWVFRKRISAAQIPPSIGLSPRA